jgi:filamentous hemagglutinin
LGGEIGGRWVDAIIDNAQTTCPHCNASKRNREFPVNPPPGYRGIWPPSWWS